MKPPIEVRIPANELPIDRRHRRAFSQMQFRNLVGQRLRARMGREMVVRTTDDRQFRIERNERQPIHQTELEVIDTEVNDALQHPDRWRADAIWNVTWSAQPEIGDDVRTGTAVWDQETVSFLIRVEVQGPAVSVGLRRERESPAKWYRCLTPFERPNDYAVDQAIERACLAWLPRFVATE
jgi:hypothetical protein